MRNANWFAGAAVALALTLAAPVSGWAQGSMNGPAASSGAVTAKPGDQAAMPKTAADKAAFVSQKIFEAQAQGKDVSAARAQERMGRAALNRGLNDEADQHFDIALRSLGVTNTEPATSPNGPQSSNSGPGSAMSASGSSMPAPGSAAPGSSMPGSSNSASNSAPGSSGSSN